MSKMNGIVIFKDKKIRTVIVDGEYYYAVIDVLNIFLESSSPKSYWHVIKRRDSQLITNCNELSLNVQNGKTYKIECANKEGLLRILQSLSINFNKRKLFEIWFEKLPSQLV